MADGVALVCQSLGRAVRVGDLPNAGEGVVATRNRVLWICRG